MDHVMRSLLEIYRQFQLKVYLHNARLRLHTVSDVFQDMLFADLGITGDEDWLLDWLFDWLF